MSIIENLHVTNFKCFKQLDVKGLGQVNLIGGKNNVGKTAFLEAVELLVLPKKALDLTRSIYEILKRRQGERKESKGVEIDFFHQNSSEIRVRCDFKDCNIIKYESDISNADIFSKDDNMDELLPTEMLTMSVNNDKYSMPIDKFLKSSGLRYEMKLNASIFIPSSRVIERDIAVYFGQLTELDKENYLNTSLAFVDSNILELKVVPTSSGVDLKLKLNNTDSLVLLSSLGEGINRYIAILCAIWANKDGFLLIDEIENGIHYTNYPKLWEIIFKVSVEANCQLFITTHSKECITAFNDMQFEVTGCHAQYFEFYNNLKTNLIVASPRDKEQLRYALTHEGRVRGE